MNEINKQTNNKQTPCAGALVPDEVMVNLVVEELAAQKRGVPRLLLDGCVLFGLSHTPLFFARAGPKPHTPTDHPPPWPPNTRRFPRTIPQAEALDQHLKIDVVVNLDIPDRTIIERISNRWIHAKSGRTYAYDYNPPKKHGLDDVTGARVHGSVL